jgi:hypothetical protein
LEFAFSFLTFVERKPDSVIDEHCRARAEALQWLEGAKVLTSFPAIRSHRASFAEKGVLVVSCGVGDFDPPIIRLVALYPFADRVEEKVPFDL